MGEIVRRQDLQIVVSLRVVWHSRKVGPPGAAAFQRVIFQAEKWDDSPKKRTLVSESGRKKGCERLRIGCTLTISSLFLKTWSQWEIPARGWESIFSKMQYLCRESRWNISCVVRLTKESPWVVRPRGVGLRNSQKRGCRGAEPGLTSKTRIRKYKFQDARMLRRVLGYDINALYPSTMEVVAHWAQAPRKVENFIEVLRRDRWLGFAEVDIEVPKELWTKFEEMPPLFYDKPVPSKTVPQHMKD